MAMSTQKAIRPSDFYEILPARFFVRKWRKKLLKMSGILFFCLHAAKINILLELALLG
jgi:hypothetical protein